MLPFKIIWKSEMKKVVTMLCSDDREMRELGRKVINKREPIRFSLSSIFCFHALIIVCVATLISWAWDKFPDYRAPQLIFGVITLAFCFMYCTSATKTRRKYNKHAEVVAEKWLD